MSFGRPAAPVRARPSIRTASRPVTGLALSFLTTGRRATVSLVKVPETRFVQSGQSYVGYQVLGDGPVDLVYAGTAFTNVDAQWGLPSLAEFLERLASFSRLILFDKRGVGVSDPVFRASMPTDRGLGGRSQRGPRRGRFGAGGAVRQPGRAATAACCSPRPTRSGWTG